MVPVAVLVLVVLPSILVLGDSIIERTRFRVKVAQRPTHTASGTMRVQGRVRGYISGMVDADFDGILRGQLNATVSTEGEVSIQEGDEENEEKNT